MHLYNISFPCIDDFDLMNPFSISQHYTWLNAFLRFGKNKGQEDYLVVWLVELFFTEVISLGLFKYY